MHTDRPVGVRF